MAEVVALNSALPAPRVLLIEDSVSDALRIGKLLERARPRCNVRRVSTLQQALKTLGEEPYDVALLDLSLPDSVDLDGLLSLQNIAPKLPVVILTGQADEGIALKAVERGAQDYLFKDKADGASIRRAMLYAVQRKQFEATLITQANFDPLTGLANRVLFESRLDMSLARIRRGGAGIGVFFLDLNRFKRINDTLGHAAGDRLLQQVAERLKQCVRPYDTVARFGGDEFALLIEGIEQARDCAIVAQKAVERLTQPFCLAGRNITAGVSIGISTCLSKEKQEHETLLEQADEAMYGAKLLKESNYRFYTDEIQEQACTRLKREEELRAALKNHQLMLYYQPKIDLQTGKTTGAEALARWSHPTRGLLLPKEFISIVEETEQADIFGDWVFATVCADIRRWRKAALPQVPIAINLFDAQLDDPGLAESLKTQMDRYEVSAETLTIEAPSSALLKHTQDRIRTLCGIHALGVKIHLDHFGAGAILLAPFAALPVDAVKIAPQLASMLDAPDSSLPLVQAIMDIAGRFNIGVIAAGIENEWQRTFFRERNCREGQGFGLCQPVPAGSMPSWLGRKE